MDRIISFLREKAPCHIHGFKPDFMERCISRRMKDKNIQEIEAYYNYLLENREELEQLVQGLIVPVSRFFRNPVVFETIFSYILPFLLEKKKNNRERYFRFWSAGCSTGEEPYSLAILLKELFKKETEGFLINIFATDIDRKALQFAQEGIFGHESIKNTRYEWVEHYFKRQDDFFAIHSEIKEAVYFSYHDLRNEKNIVPPESIFGYFDLVFCRNVLIYYDIDTQMQILKNLLKSMAPGGYLVLGESESIPARHQIKAKRILRYSNVYRKLVN